MNRTYECMLLLDNREVKKGWEPLKETVAGVFQKHGAEVVSARRWEERRLAYPIRRQSRGTYLLVYYNGDTERNAAIRRDLDFNESVLRHMTLVCDEVPADAYQPEAEFDVDAIPVGDERREPEEASAEEAESSEKEGETTEESSESQTDEKSGSDEGGEQSAEGDNDQSTEETKS